MSVSSIISSIHSPITSREREDLQRAAEDDGLVSQEERAEIDTFVEAHPDWVDTADVETLKRFTHPPVHPPADSKVSAEVLLTANGNAVDKELGTSLSMIRPDYPRLDIWNSQHVPIEYLEAARATARAFVSQSPTTKERNQELATAVDTKLRALGEARKVAFEEQMGRVAVAGMVAADQFDSLPRAARAGFHRQLALEQYRNPSAHLEGLYYVPLDMKGTETYDGPAYTGSRRVFREHHRAGIVAIDVREGEPPKVLDVFDVPLAPSAATLTS